MNLAIFDLDNTLINGDSDHAWGEFLVENNIVDQEEYAFNNDKFYHDYTLGALDINAYLNFCLKVLAEHTLEQLLSWREQFIEKKIRPILLPKAKALIEKHRSDGDTLLIITATNRFVTEPIAKMHGINNLLASEAEKQNGCYTGKPTGIPCYQEGKITRLNQWLEQQEQHFDQQTFYSDSHNDLPLLKQVDTPVAVDPDPQLFEYATTKGWSVCSLRDAAK
ncbi:MAG: HAD family hydrolase [Pseudomonadales bacterium]|nr:HAD family hydrolase [Pseudomonadales bacterium]